VCTNASNMHLHSAAFVKLLCHFGFPTAVFVLVWRHCNGCRKLLAGNRSETVQYENLPCNMTIYQTCRLSGWYHDLGLIKGMIWKMACNNLYLWARLGHSFETGWNKHDSFYYSKQNSKFYHRVKCYDVFIKYFNRGNNWFVPKCSVTLARILDTCI
jgi:hypothetical protein